MARKSSSKLGLGLLGLLLVLLMLQGGVEVAVAQPRLWPVGDSKGWNFDVLGWPNYKPFKEGDVLLFKYDPSKHNVMVVTELEYSLCQVPTNATVYSSGNDRVTLPLGMTFFMCGFPGHCQNKMKIAVTAARR